MSDDLQAIRNLSYAYTRCLDNGDWTEVAAILGDATLRAVSSGMSGAEVRGAPEIERFYREQVVVDSLGRPRTRHLVTNHSIELDPTGTRARGDSYFTVLQKPAGKSLQIVVTGRYEDEFACANGEWRFVSKTIHADYFGEIRHHFLIAAEQRD